MTIRVILLASAWTIWISGVAALAGAPYDAYIRPIRRIVSEGIDLKDRHGVYRVVFHRAWDFAARGYSSRAAPPIGASPTNWYVELRGPSSAAISGPLYRSEDIQPQRSRKNIFMLDTGEMRYAHLRAGSKAVTRGLGDGWRGEFDAWLAAMAGAFGHSELPVEISGQVDKLIPSPSPGLDAPITSDFVPNDVVWTTIRMNRAANSHYHAINGICIALWIAAQAGIVWSYRWRDSLRQIDAPNRSRRRAES